MGGGASSQTHISQSVLNSVASTAVFKAQQSCFTPGVAQNSVNINIASCDGGPLNVVGGQQSITYSFNSSCTMSSKSTSEMANQVASTLAQKASDTTDGLSTALNTMASAISGSSDDKDISTSIANVINNSVNMDTLQQCVKGGMSNSNNFNLNFGHVQCGNIFTPDQSTIVNIVSQCMLGQESYAQAITDLTNKANQDVTLKTRGPFDFINDIVSSMGKYSTYIIVGLSVAAVLGLFVLMNSKSKPQDLAQAVQIAKR